MSPSPEKTAVQNCGHFFGRSWILLDAFQKRWRRAPLWPAEMTSRFPVLWKKKPTWRRHGRANTFTSRNVPVCIVGYWGAKIISENWGKWEFYPKKGWNFQTRFNVMDHTNWGELGEMCQAHDFGMLKWEVSSSTWNLCYWFGCDLGKRCIHLGMYTHLCLYLLYLKIC